jgi:hypothetical protein
MKSIPTKTTVNTIAIASSIASGPRGGGSIRRSCWASSSRLGEMLRSSVLIALASSLVLALSGVALADSVHRAKRIHDRLVGIPPSPQRLAEIADMLDTEGDVEAALYALEHPVFYSSTLKSWVTPRTNVDQTVYAPLNDYSATLIGMVRDDVPFNTVLSADLVYMGRNGIVSDGYSQSNNNHYEQLERDRVDLSNENDFVARAQSTLPGSQLSSSDAAGIITTRAAGEAFFSAGTNRRMFRFLMMNYLCRDMEDLHDPAIAADWIRQDVSRSPGGDSSIFRNSCIGCHTGMDPMSGSFAFFDWREGDEDNDNNNGRVIHTPGQVQPKYLQNGNTFPFGYVTADNRWENRWLSGKNSALGWPSFPRDGYGPKSMGQAITNSDAFATCQVEKVFEQVCFRPDLSQEDRDAITTITNSFKANGVYSLKQVFAEVAAYCTLPDAN